VNERICNVTGSHYEMNINFLSNPASYKNQ